MFPFQESAAYPTRTLDDDAQDLEDRLQNQDATLTHLQINGYHYPFGDFLKPARKTATTTTTTESTTTKDMATPFDPLQLSSTKVAQLLRAAISTPHVQSLELRFIEFDHEVSTAFQSLLIPKENDALKTATYHDETKNEKDSIRQGKGICEEEEDNVVENVSRRTWKSITLTACLGLNQEDFSALALVLMKNQCIDLQWQHNVGSEAGFMSLGMAMAVSQSLQTLQMTRQDLRREQDIQALFGRGLGRTQTNLVLNFCKFDKVDALAEAIAHNTSLEELDLGASYLTDDQVEAIVAAIIGHPSLKRLILTLNSCQTKGGHAIGMLLQDWRCQLQSLHLGHQVSWSYQAPTTAPTTSNVAGTLATTTGSSTRFGIKVIANALIHNRSLKELKLGRNKLESQDVISLFSSLEVNTALQRLDLSGNEINDDSFASLLAKSLRNATGLQKLSLKDNPLSSYHSGQALLETLEQSNHILTVLELPRSFPFLSSIQYQLALNLAGRRLLTTTASSHIPLGLWPLVLEKTTKLDLQRSQQRSTNPAIKTAHHRPLRSQNPPSHDMQSQTRSTKMAHGSELYDKDSLYFMLSNATDLVRHRQ